MKKLIYSLALLSTMLIVASCEMDPEKDPLQFEKMKKGKLLALRGTQLDNIYRKAIPGALFVPGIIDGTETFDFDGEFLTDDPNALESVDIFVVKKSGERVKISNVPFSQFKTTSDYRGPWVSISLNIKTILGGLGIDASTLPLSTADLNKLFTDYKNGIAIESDLNLVDGTKVTAGDLVAAGLYQSDIFYPAQKLNYAVIKYCAEDLEGTYDFTTTVTAVGAGGDISGCDGGVTGSGELIKLSGAYGTYSISDVTFGQYDCAWGDNPATGATLINTCSEISIGGSDQYGLVYAFADITVSGDQKSLTFKWSNDYGDAGTTTLTRTDSKLWPADLN